MPSINASAILFTAIAPTLSPNIIFLQHRAPNNRLISTYITRCFLARALARRFDDALRPIGLTNGQFSLMMSLNRPQPPDMGAVASLLGMNRTTLTAALKPLQRRGLLMIKVDPTDRRSRIMTLTPRGRRLLARAVPVWRRTHVAVEALLPDGDPDRFR